MCSENNFSYIAKIGNSLESLRLEKLSRQASVSRYPSNMGIPGMPLVESSNGQARIRNMAGSCWMYELT
jgi:hypothetical protein